MSAADDRQVLMEYEAWKDRDVDLSIDAFLQRREDEANTKRVAEALDSLNAHIFNFEQRVTQGTESSGLENNMLAALEGVRAALEAERPWIEAGSLTEGPKRVYV